MILKLFTRSRNEKFSSQVQTVKIPNLCGMSVRTCIKTLSTLGVEYKIVGSGRVISQSLSPGETISSNQQITVNCALNQ